MATLLTDRNALGRARARAERIGDDSAWVVHRAAADEIQERLNEVNRAFTDPAIVGPKATLLTDVLPQSQTLEDKDKLEFSRAPRDLVVHFMSLHWADDLVGQLVQCRHALVPDGLFLGVFPGGQTLQELRSVLAQAETDILGGLSPRVVPMGELRDLGALLMRSGFALPVADMVALDLRYPNLSSLIHDLRATGETNALTARLKKPMSRHFLRRAEDLYRAHFTDDDGRLIVTVELVFLTGWAPSDSQQKPLRPGSARSRLADALGTKETPLGDPPSFKDD